MCIMRLRPIHVARLNDCSRLSICAWGCGHVVCVSWIGYESKRRNEDSLVVLPYSSNLEQSRLSYMMILCH